jgi:hypothetical protein
LLAVGGRPAERRIVEEHDSKIDAAHAFVASPATRRTSIPERGLRPELAVTIDSFVLAPPRRTVHIVLEREPTQRIARIVRSGSSRGPPGADQLFT